MKWIERVKTLLLVGLFLSFTILTVVYIAAVPQKSDVGGNLPSDVLDALHGGAAKKDTLQSDQLLPDFFGLKQPGESPVGLQSGADMMHDLNELISPWIGFVLGEEITCSPCTQKEGEARWRTCTEATAYFYLRWSSAFPAAFLRAHALPDEADAMIDTAQGEMPRICEMFILPEGQTDDGVCAVSRDAAGNVVLWRLNHQKNGMPDDLPTFDDFAIYQSRGVLQPFGFADNLYAEITFSLSSLPVLLSAETFPALQAMYPFSAYTGAERIPDRILEYFEYNLNKAGSYFENDTDTAVFVETHGTLRATAYTLDYEATLQGGLPVENFLSRTNTSLNFRDDIMACEALVLSLSQAERSLFGGAAEPQLVSVRAEGEMLILAYAYFYDNVRIRTDAPSIVITVRDHKIISVSMEIVNYRADEYHAPAGGQTWMLQLSEYLRARDAEEKVYLIDLWYTIDETAPERLIAEWRLYQMP